MTPADFTDALQRLGLSRAALARELAARTGQKVNETTLWRYASGRSAVPIGLAAYLQLRLEVNAARRELAAATV